MSGLESQNSQTCSWTQEIGAIQGFKELHKRCETARVKMQQNACF